MKKYSSYKSIKPLNTSFNYVIKSPQTPTHSASYHKGNPLELQNQRLLQKPEIYSMTPKYSTLSASNANRKKMFSNKNLHVQTNGRPLTLTKSSNQDNSISAGYKDIKTKITDLSNRLNEIKKNYDKSVQVRKCSDKQSQIKPMKQNDRFINPKLTFSQKNKQNEAPKQKKTQSNLLLERFHANNKLKHGQPSSTINLNQKTYQNFKNQSKIHFDQGKNPLSPKNLQNFVNRNLKKIIKQNDKEQRNFKNKSDLILLQQTKLSKVNSNVNNDLIFKKQQTNKKISINVEGEKKYPLNDKSSVQQDRQQPVSPKSQSSYLKQYVTTFTCDNRLPLCHSTSETNLYKPKNKLSQKSAPNEYYVSAVISAFESKTLTSFENLCRNHINTSLEILTYIKNSKKQAPLKYTKIALSPPKDKRNTIIFDLDETLIHCNQNLNINHDVSLPIKFPNGQLMKAGINIRPYARECLLQLSKHFQLIVFTASHQCYGNVIVDYLDPKGELISYRYFRDSCYKTEQGFYVKDLRVIDRDLAKMLLIDNAAYSYCFQLENGVPIIPFYDNKADLELKNLTSYLKGFAGSTDVRPQNHQKMKLSQYTKFKDVKSLIHSLYTINQ